MTDILTTLLKIFATSEKLISHGRIKQFFSGTFLGGHEKVAAAMSDLKRLMDTEEKLVVSLTYSATQGMNKTVERTERTVERNEQALDGIVGSLNGKLHSRLRTQRLCSMVTSLNFPTDAKALEPFIYQRPSLLYCFSSVHVLCGKGSVDRSIFLQLYYKNRSRPEKYKKTPTM